MYKKAHAVKSWYFPKKWSKRVSVVGLPVAILIHTVTALIFATQASRGWWNTAILPPDFIAGALVVHFFFVAMDLIVHGWWGEESAREALRIVFGPYAPLYAVEIILPLAVALYFFSKRAAGSRQGLIISSVLLFIGVFAHRLMLIRRYPFKPKHHLS